MLDFEFPEISEATAWKNYVDSFVLVEITQYVAGAARVPFTFCWSYRKSFLPILIYLFIT